MPCTRAPRRLPLLQLLHSLRTCAGTLFFLVAIQAFQQFSRADVFRWDNGQLLPDTIGITPGPQVDLGNRDLQFAALYFNDLTGANFSHSNLSRADLQQSQLAGAKFRDANLTGAYLYYSNLSGAEFDGAIIQGTNFDDSTSRGFTKEQLSSTRNFQQQQLVGVSLRFNDLSGWDFQGQDLSGADFTDSTLAGVNFDGAVVRGAGFANAKGLAKNQLYATASYQLKDLSGINLSANNLNSWDFSGQNLTNAGFSNSSMSFTKFDDAEIVGANLDETTSRAFHPLQLYSTASYKRKDLRGVSLSNNDLTDWDLSGQDLTGVSLNYSTVTGANFAGATIKGVHFYGATQRGFTQSQLYSTASYQQKDLRDILFDGDWTGWDFSGQNLASASLGGKLTNANLTGAWIQDARLGAITSSQLYSTASYQAKNLRGVYFSSTQSQALDLTGQDLTDSDLTRISYALTDFTDAVIRGANFQQVRNFRPEQLYSTASYKNHDLRELGFGYMDLQGWNFSQQDLTGASLSSSKLAGANLTGAVIKNVGFGETTPFGLTKAQFYSTKSYQDKELGAVEMRFNNLDGWDFAGQNLMNSHFHSATMNQVNLSFADTRGATNMDLSTAHVRNMIRSDGSMLGVTLGPGERLVVRNYEDDTNVFNFGPIPVVVLEQMKVAGGVLRLQFDSKEWASTISFQPQIEVALDGTLELEFAQGVSSAEQSGRTFRIFDWSGVAPVGSFAIQSSYLWDTTDLESLGVVTLISGLHGDTNGDNIVDLSDLNAVRNHFGEIGAPGMPGDAIPFDGIVDLFDLNNVRNGFGASAAVPEPASLAVGAMGLVAWALFFGRPKNP